MYVFMCYFFFELIRKKKCPNRTSILLKYLHLQERVAKINLFVFY